MTASQYSHEPEEVEDVQLVLVDDTPKPDETSVRFSYSIEPFRPSANLENPVEITIDSVVLNAITTYRQNMGGKSGIDLDVERRNQRRNFAYNIFRELGMLHLAVVPIDENSQDPRLDEDIRADFVKNHFDPAERQADDMDRHDINDLIEERFMHPVIRAANQWTRLGGKENNNMRTDAILVTRASAIILKNIGEVEYKEDLED